MPKRYTNFDVASVEPLPVRGAFQFMSIGAEKGSATSVRICNVFPFGKPSSSDPAPPLLRSKPLGQCPEESCGDRTTT
jgi:hypothetical protein